MKNKNDFGMLAGFAATVIGFIGLIWKVIETTIYRFRNPDFTIMRVLIENPHLIIWLIIYVGVFCSGLRLIEHYKNNRRK